MANLNSSLLRLPFFLGMFSLTVTQQEPPVYWTYLCPDNTTFTPNSAYQRNLNHLLSSLSSNSSRSTGFYNLTVGTSPDVVYGLFLCRGDLSADVCRICVETAGQEITKLCPVEKVSGIYYNECMLRYSNNSFFSTVELEPYLTGYSKLNVTDATRFAQLLRGALRETHDKAVREESGKKFGVAKVNFTAFQTIYTLAQCVPYFSERDCDRCLQAATGRLLTDWNTRSQGGRAVLPSCNIRFELDLFYNETAASAPLPEPESPSPTSPDASSRDNEPYPIYNETVAVAPPRETKILSPASPDASGRGKATLVISTTTVLAFLSIVLLALYYWWRRKSRKESKKNSPEMQLLELSGGYTEGCSNENPQGDQPAASKDLPLWPLNIIRIATQHFSDTNKLGEGGFGPVYKGILANDKEIAVKRLSRSSGQGLQEFKNEVTLIAKLQHRNLVRLLGCCLEGNEKLLIYEFMPNKSVDFFLFNSTRSAQLNWKIRFSIINGIARGLLYMHEDSRLKIIHRDLKTSNILLDHEMNPKISDFGMARIFHGNQIEANTNRVVGTYGYMAPEYAMEGLFSVKSDVFSFGVLVLEIISRRKNNGFHLSEKGQSLLTYSWKLWSEDHRLDLLDSSLANSYVLAEVLKCIHIGLLCVQEDPADRPSMSSVYNVLTSETVKLSQPKQPAFSIGREVETLSQTSSDAKVSTNEITLTEVLGR